LVYYWVAIGKKGGGGSGGGGGRKKKKGGERGPAIFSLSTDAGKTKKKGGDLPTICPFFSAPGEGKGKKLRGKDEEEKKGGKGGSPAV